MRARHPRIPTQWLMTDERLGQVLWDALERIPRGQGVIFRHYTLEIAARRSLYLQVAKVARRRRLMLIVAGSDGLGPGNAGIHGRSAKRARGILTWPAHNLPELIAANRAKADMVLISPVFATRSHPGTRTLGLARAASLARQADMPAIALGGIQKRHSRHLKSAGFHGWAAIDAWIEPEIRNVGGRKS